MPIAGLRTGINMRVSARVTVIESGFVSVAITGSRGMNGLILIAIQLNWMSGYIRDMIHAELGRSIIGGWLRIFENSC
jgi:hypothetical protein